MKNKNNNSSSKSVAKKSGPLVTRSQVPAGKEYTEYRVDLRYDFFYSCAYCTMSEAEAQAIRFVIDHYEPKSGDAALKDVYDNLMYCCDECNSRKGDRFPPATARSQGFRFFRPDQDAFEDHFERRDLRLKEITNIGSYSIDALDLNRNLLRRLRQIRSRLAACDELVAGGVRALRKFHIDQLPQHIKGRALKAIIEAEKTARDIEDQLDQILRDHAKSSLIQDEPESDTRTKTRKERLKDLETIFPGVWRGRDVSE